MRGALVLVAGLAALVSGCGSSSSNSAASPSAPTGSVATANSDGSTLKVSAPVPTSPANNASLGQGVTSAQLQATTSSAQYSPGVALTYRFEVYKGAVAGTPFVTAFGTPSGSTVSAGTGPLDFLTGYLWRVRAEWGGATGPWSSTQSFTTGGQARRDANAYGGKVPRSIAIADLNSQLLSVAGSHPTELNASCNNGRNAIDFPTVLLQALRQIDNRWGYNCRRGNCADPSNDVVVYHWSPGSSEQSTNVYIFDVIGGRDAVAGCNPQVVDVTDVTYGSGSTGRFSLLGRFPPNNPDY